MNTNNSKSLIVKNSINISLINNNIDNLQNVNEIYGSIQNGTDIIKLDKSYVIKEVIYNIIRQNNYEINNVGILVLAGIKNLKESHLELTVRELINILLSENNEVKPNNKINFALSTIMNRIPKDIKESVKPNDKTALLVEFRKSNLVEKFTSRQNNINNVLENEDLSYSEMRNQLNTVLGRQPVRVGEGSQRENRLPSLETRNLARQYGSSPSNLRNSVSRSRRRSSSSNRSSSGRRSRSTRTSDTTPNRTRSNRDLEYNSTPMEYNSSINNNIDAVLENDTLSYNQRRSRLNTILGRTTLDNSNYIPNSVDINNDYDTELSNYYQKYENEKLGTPPSILATYIDNQPNLIKAKDGKIYFYDDYSGSLTEIPSKEKIMNQNKLVNLLQTHKIGQEEVDRVFEEIKVKDATNIPISFENQIQKKNNMDENNNENNNENNSNYIGKLFDNNTNTNTTTNVLNSNSNNNSENKENTNLVDNVSNLSDEQQIQTLNDYQKEENEEDSNVIYIVIGIIVFIVILAVIGFLYYRRYNNNLSNNLNKKLNKTLNNIN